MCCLSALEGKGGESEEKAMKKYEFTSETWIKIYLLIVDAFVETLTNFY